MKAILKTVKPKQCANIMNLIQSILVIKDKREATAIQKLIDEDGYADIYVYCMKDKKNYLYWDWYDPPFVENEWFVSSNSKIWNDDRININGPFNGKVVFKFRCYNVEEIYYNSIPTEEYFYYIYKGDEYDNEEDKIDTSLDLEEKSCLNSDELDNYLQGKTGYAIHISDLEIFDKPKELSEFRKPRYCDCKLRCNNNLEHSFCREVCSHNLDSERLGVCCDRDGWVKEWNTGNMNLTKSPQNFCYVENAE